MSRRKIYEGLPLPAFLMPEGLKGTVLEVDGVSKQLWRHSRRQQCQPHDRRRRDPCADRPERRRQDHAVQSGLGPLPDRQRHHPPQRPRDPGHPVRIDLPSAAWRARSRSPICFAAFRSTRTCACRCRRDSPGTIQHLARHRQLSRHPRRDRGAGQVSRPRGHRADRGRRAVLWRAAAGRSRHRARLQAAGAAAGRAARGPCRRRARAGVEPRQERRRQHPGPDRRARHRPRARLLADASP